MKIPYAVPSLGKIEEEYVVDAVKSTWISGGVYVDCLEKSLREKLGVRNAITVSNGTTALQLAYMALGLKAGDEVIVPGFGFMAAANLLLHFGAIPVFADVDPHTWCMTALDIEKKITKNTKAIVPIHTYGNVCEMDDIMNLVGDIPVIEDGAEALFSQYNGKYCGTIGSIGTFSMHATKTITTGEGGFVICNDDTLYELMSTIRSHGLPKRGTYNHMLAGHNFRLTNVQASIGCAQFTKIDWIIAERNRIFETYKKYLHNQEGIELQQITTGVTPVIWAVAVKVNPLAYPQGRDGLTEMLREGGIETRPGFVPSCKLGYFVASNVPNSEILGDTVISFPTYPSLSDNDIANICEKLILVRG